MRVREQLKGYDLGSFLNCSSHLRLASMMLWKLVLPISGAWKCGRCRKRSCSLWRRAA